MTGYLATTELINLVVVGIKGRESLVLSIQIREVRHYRTHKSNIIKNILSYFRSL